VEGSASEYPPGMTCLHCSQTGPPGNHCAYCLWSLHLVDDDAWPEFRLTGCHGLMRPVRVRGNTVIHRCTACGQRSSAMLTGSG
jgi:hypothetical protein